MSDSAAAHGYKVLFPKCSKYGQGCWYLNCHSRKAVGCLSAVTLRKRNKLITSLSHRRLCQSFQTQTMRSTYFDTPSELFSFASFSPSMQHTGYLLCTHYVGLLFAYLFFWPQKKKSNLHDSGGFQMSDKASRGIQGSMAQCNKHGMTKKKKRRQQRDIWEMSLQNFHTQQKSELPCNLSLAQLITQLIKEWMQALFSFFIFKHCVVLQRSDSLQCVVYVEETPQVSAPLLWDKPSPLQNFISVGRKHGPLI